MNAMKRIFLTFALLLAFVAPALATDFSIVPYPKGGVQATTDDWKAAVMDLRSINATGMAVMKKWSELEPQKGKYNLKTLAEDFAFNAREGRKVLFSLHLINTVRRELPPDLNDVEWDDPALLARYEMFLEAMAQAGMTAPKYMSLGNEVDIYFEKHPDEVKAYLKFYHRAVVATQKVFPNTRIGITVTYEGLPKQRGELVQQMVDASEVAIFTYYPVFDLKPQPVENVGANLDAILKIAGNKNVLLQEAGYPSGEGIGSSAEKQAFFYRALLGGIKQRGQIKFASLFLLHDFEKKVCDDMIVYYGFEKAPQRPKEKFRDFLCSLGVKNADGTPKPAWDVVQAELK